MRLSVFSAIGRVQLSADWDGTYWLMLRPTINTGRSVGHRAWQFVWLRGNVRAEIKTR